MRYDEIKRWPIHRPTAEDIADIRRMRHEIRCEEGAGGQCGWVAEYCENTYGWEKVGGTYCNDADEPICCDHVWCLLPDGAIFDPTADQMGLGYDMRIVEPNDPDYHKYREQWHEDYNPGQPDEYPELKDRKWSGKYDDEWAREIRAKRGQNWHVTDRNQYREYLKQAKAYEKGKAKPEKPFGPSGSSP